VTASGAISALMYPIQLPPYLRRVGIEERPALDRFLAAWWQATLTTWPSRCEPQGILKVIDSCGERIAPYLEAWPTDSNPPPALHLAEMLADLTAGDRSHFEFRDDLDAWLCGPVPEAILIAAARGGPATAQAGRALEDLGRYRRWYCGATG
jgi:hypothetical protein